MSVRPDLSSPRSLRLLAVAGVAGRLAAAGTAAAALSLAALASPAGAHVSPDKTEVPAGGYTDIKLGVGHGCEGSPTTKLEVQIPSEVLNVTPYIVAGWTVEVATESLTEPVEASQGEQITERDAVVTWTADPGSELPEGFKVQFGLSFQAPDAEGTALHFPTIQTCQEGANDWIEIPVEGEEEPENPAPTVLVVAGSGDGHGSSTAEETDGEETDGEAATPVASSSGVSSTDDDDGDDSGNGLAIAGLVAGLGGLGLGGAAFAKPRS